MGYFDWKVATNGTMTKKKGGGIIDLLLLKHNQKQMIEFVVIREYQTYIIELKIKQTYHCIINIKSNIQNIQYTLFIDKGI
jgi:hypothetical protein